MKLVNQPTKTFDLHQKTFDLWVSLHEILDCYCQYTNPNDPVFLAELETYGDPQLESTWQTAYANLTARLFVECLDDPQFLVEFYLIDSPKHEGWINLRESVMRALLEIPVAVTALLDGLLAIREYGYCQKC